MTIKNLWTTSSSFEFHPELHRVSQDASSITVIQLCHGFDTSKHSYQERLLLWLSRTRGLTTPLHFDSSYDYCTCKTNTL